MADSEPIINLPDTLVTTFLGNDTFISVGYLRELQLRVRGLSYENPLAQISDGRMTMAIKPINKEQLLEFLGSNYES